MRIMCAQCDASKRMHHQEKDTSCSNSCQTWVHSHTLTTSLCYVAGCSYRSLISCDSRGSRPSTTCARSSTSWSQTSVRPHQAPACQLCHAPQRLACLHLRCQVSHPVFPSVASLWPGTCNMVTALRATAAILHSLHRPQSGTWHWWVIWLLHGEAQPPAHVCCITLHCPYRPCTPAAQQSCLGTVVMSAALGTHSLIALRSLSKPPALCCCIHHGDYSCCSNAR